MLTADIIYMTYGIFCTVIGIFNNTVILLAFPFKSKTATLVNFFIKVISITDLLTCLFFIPLMLALKFSNIHSDAFCKIVTFLYNVSIDYGLITNFFVAVERWFSAFKPYVLKMKFIYIVNLLNFFLALCIAGYEIFSYEFQEIGKNSSIFQCVDIKFRSNKFVIYLFFSMYWLCFLIVLILYITVFFSLSKRIRNSSDYGNKKDMRNRIIELRAGLMLFGKAFVFVSLWIPFWIRNIKGYLMNVTVEHIYYFNSSISFYIYITFNNKFRKNFTFYFTRKKNQIKPSIAES